MDKWFEVEGLEIEGLLAEWHWLCPSRFSLVARNVFAELFLQDESGSVFWLNTTSGKLNKVSNSHSEFLKMAETTEKRREWFVEHEAVTYARLGLVPGATQCIGFGVPAVFAEGGTPDTAFIADIYEHVSFLGDLHRQIASSPDGTKVRLRVNPPRTDLK